MASRARRLRRSWGFACFAILAYAVAEHSLAPVHAAAYRKKISAVRMVQRSEAVIRRPSGLKESPSTRATIPTTRE